jgi:hypothetical protein
MKRKRAPKQARARASRELAGARRRPLLTEDYRIACEALVAVIDGRGLTAEWREQAKDALVQFEFAVGDSRAHVLPRTAAHTLAAERAAERPVEEALAELRASMAAHRAAAQKAGIVL